MKKCTFIALLIILNIFCLSLNVYCQDIETHCFYNDYPKDNHKVLEIFFNKHYLGENTITILIQQPHPQSHYAINKDDYFNAGHAFIRLQYYEVDSIDIKNKKVLYIGFYPTNRLSTEQIIYLKSVDGYLNTEKDLSRPEWDHTWNIGKVYIVSDSEIKSALEYIDDFEKNKYKFHMLKNNCTTFAINVLNSANVKHNFHERSVTLTLSQWIFVKMHGYKIRDMLCYCAGNIGEDIRKSGNFLILTDKGIVENPITITKLSKIKKFFNVLYSKVIL